MSFFSKLRERLTKSSSKIGTGLDDIVAEAPAMAEVAASAPAPAPAPDEQKEAPVASTDPQTVHQPGIDWAKETGLMVGYTDGTFRPNQPVTRGELATILHRYHEKNARA